MQADHGGRLKMRRTDTAASLISVSSPMCTCGHGIGTEAIGGDDFGRFEQKKNYPADSLNVPAQDVMTLAVPGHVAKFVFR